MSYWKLLTVLAVIACAPAVATAHVLSVDHKTVGDKLEIVASFNNDLPADDAAVEVRTFDGALVAEGKTDANGKWVGSLPPPGRYTLTVRAFGDHTRTVELEVRPDHAMPPTAATNGWMIKAALVVGVLIAWVGLLLWLRRRRDARASGGGAPVAKPPAPDA
jgi:hypothetical protein